MELFAQLFSLLVVAITTAFVYKKIFAHRSQVSCNSVMLAAMGLSTINGLVMGTILALTQSFSLNCILSMIIGVCTGLILGILFNTMTTIEGMLGGVMGGLMGAMLGAMLELSYIYIITGILIITLLAVTILLVQMIQQEIVIEKEDLPVRFISAHTNKQSLLIVSTSVLLFSGILFSTTYEGQPNEQQPEPTEEHQHHH